ncbi:MULTISPECIES: 1,2-phenylacetyl-CoA epoxidase subunit PaaD [Alicyclobacillus]|uniref:Phenylacetate-CoA oxygenase subunit PaaJ n=1 Tax=Alicyclobacillus acidoterrestris (strain ATCC 49025 / DSM 3922 / CIP 106132 / NCIMB 13137 / GD3B) TaxID=1356854 RepID=T0CJ22_ALIAG|nr:MULTISPECIES: 1,2-phenylacetyl-CoA epoxidase subunit PaaD [Alicyclobacillus]EPZ52829.1 hypothetical protein N007_19540 [Alicyclobacillus acidoterrestris ATCC 49025]UNO48724.1 phenylacetate-CoA oxygenase subunit PaaJ [Alicyclobacillus acidoterrestris]
MEKDTLYSDEALTSALIRALHDVKDPEIPAVSISELGMVYSVKVENGYGKVELLPTFVGCPALEFIRNRVLSSVRGLDGLVGIDVEFVMTKPWSSDRITPEGIRKLREFGIAPPLSNAKHRVVPPCPYCGAADTEIENLFGPTACRAIFYCKNCCQPFEGMKVV